jgi:protein ImuB
MNAPVSKSFFFAANAHAPEQVSRLLERLRARLGAAALYRLRTHADHRPEHAWRKVESWQPGKTTEKGQPVRCRPLWLLADPQSLEQFGGWPAYGGPLEIRRGPERIEGGWWAGTDVARDYYTACTQAGVRLWIYRDRHAPHGWFLHGIFG